jgi:two-component system cell cycle response regulator
MAARILVIEDNSANLELMRYLLTASGYEPVTFEDGQLGLEAAQLKPPDLIICDIQMPRIDGYAILNRLRAIPELARTAVVAVTALAMVGDRDKILAAGFDGYLSKPIEPETFVTQVEQWLPPPLRSDLAASRAATTPSPAAPAPTGRSVLAVDNMPTNLELLTSLLEGAGYRVVTAPGANAALRLAGRDPPDLILSDVCMQEGSGYDFIREVKADPGLARIPFIFITSTAATERERQKGLGLGAAKYLFRPIEPQVLLAEIAGCFAQSEAD